MNLAELLLGQRVIRATVPLEQTVGRLSHNSDDIVKGDTFIAMQGLRVDGHTFIAQAISKGASLVICQKSLPDDVPHVQLAEIDIALLAARFYDFPATKLQMVGVTGTNGKTTVTHMVHEVLMTLGYKAGLIGTNRIRIGYESMKSDRTTPGALKLQSILAEMVDASVTHCVMEVSSHALAMGRVSGIQFAVAAFTNLTQDHLDYHNTMEAYFETKKKLFDQCDKRVILIDTDYGQQLKQAYPQSYCVGVETGDLSARDIKLPANAVHFTAHTLSETQDITWHTPGRFSLENALVALGCLTALGLTLAQIAKPLYDAPPVKGRLEPVPFSEDCTVLIDYAHTPDALENVLTTARQFTDGKLLCVFGCGGNRDETKRPLMGQIATRYADVTVLTSDNPRDEDPLLILAQIQSGCHGHYETIPDRREAIGWALREAKRGDVVLLCGKGHETYQEILGVQYPMDEREIVEAYRHA